MAFIAVETREDDTILFSYREDNVPVRKQLLEEVPKQLVFRFLALMLLRGLNTEEVERDGKRVTVRTARCRCTECDACKLVKDTQMLLMPQPYGAHSTHADSRTVKCWHSVLFHNPCDKWPKTYAQKWLELNPGKAKVLLSM